MTYQVKNVSTISKEKDAITNCREHKLSRLSVFLSKYKEDSTELDMINSHNLSPSTHQLHDKCHPKEQHLTCQPHSSHPCTITTDEQVKSQNAKRNIVILKVSQRSFAPMFIQAKMKSVLKITGGGYSILIT